MSAKSNRFQDKNRRAAYKLLVLFSDNNKGYFYSNDWRIALPNDTQIQRCLKGLISRCVMKHAKAGKISGAILYNNHTKAEMKRFDGEGNEYQLQN